MNMVTEISVFWNGTLREVVQCEKDPRGNSIFFIGEDPSCNFAVPAYMLGGQTKFSLLDQIQGEALELGPWKFRARQFEAMDKFNAPKKVNWRAQSFIGLSLLVHAVFMFIVYLIPPDASGLSFDHDTSQSQLAKYMLTAKEIHPDFIEQIKSQENKADGGKEGQREKGQAGQAGKRDAKITNNRYGVKGPANNPNPHLARETIKEMASNAGILGILDQAPTSPFGEKLALGADPENALGSLTGDKYGENKGYGGLYINGTGRGSGGDGKGTIGVGNIPTLGTKGKGDGNFDLVKKRRSSGPGPTPGGPKMLKGSLHKDVIRRHIHRKIAHIKHCYERGLGRNNELAGRVSINFIIASGGNVIKSTVAGTTLNDHQVEQCIAEAVKRITFPQPPDGGIVMVTYPFNLAASQN